MDATTNANDWFPGLGGATQGGSGSYINPGTYLLAVVALTRKVSQNPKQKGARMVIAEFKVSEVLNALEKDGDFAASNKRGEHVTVIINLDGAYPTLEQGKLKGILEGAFGAMPEEECAAVLEGMGVKCPKGADPWVVLAAHVTTPPGTTLAGETMLCTAGKTRSRAGKPVTTLRFAGAPAAAEGA
jgi:hypothetical protein